MFMTDIIARALAAKALRSSGAGQYNSKLNFPTIGESGKLYVDTSTAKLYYWDETTMAYLPLGGTGITDKAEIETIAEVAAEAKVEEVLSESILDCGESSEDDDEMIN